jgi:CSLREA domain-containing protein
MALAATLALGIAGPASAQSGLVLVVTSAADGGDSQSGDGVCAAAGGGCTLRAAIQEANVAAGHDTIQFAIGSGVQTIATQSNLPAITSPVTIDGTTQPGFSGSPLIVVSGGGRFNGFKVTSGGSTLRGLVISRFSGDGVELSGEGGNVLETNYIGLDADGTTPAANSASGVVILNSSNNRIGGPSIAQRNVISNNTGKGNGGGIYISGGSGNVVQGNFIGTDVTGMLERANEGRGIALSGTTNNLIGGPAPGAGNLISGNRATATRLIGAHGNIIQGNYMGVNRTVTAFIPNDRGVQLRDSNDNQVLNNLLIGHTYDGVLIWGGSNNTLRENVIALNGRGPVGDASESGFAGVWISTGTGNRLLGNSIYGNAMLGIALGGWSPVVNDAGDGDTGANMLQNYPRLNSVTQSGGTTVVAGVLNSSASTAYFVQVFADSECDSTGAGEGRYFIGNANLATDASGQASFTWSFGVAVPRGWFVTATATDPAGNTSGFSGCALVR